MTQGTTEDKKVLLNKVENIYNQINVTCFAVFSLQLAGAFFKSKNQILISYQLMGDD